MRETKHISVLIEKPFAEVNGFLSEPRNFSKWASGLGAGLKQIGGEWIVESQGTAKVRFTPRNEFGIADHTVTLANGDVVFIPLRAIAYDDATEVVLSLFRLPEMTDAQFAKDAETIERDLHKLKSVLEQGLA